LQFEYQLERFDPILLRLFLFFVVSLVVGHPSARPFCLLGAPAVFILQAQPVKLLLKQLYALFDQPPFLDLLPSATANAF
jgi:hypothetical protein